ncbi:hypothetical protein F6X56_31470 [Rhodococcus erythropolis]|uniref:hypothetical protein n=1 Tax=Rhodococcus TaxID=1827 RepID=UPI0012468289|nr:MULTISPECIES: hypothetical protein [Rhodococcus]MCJ0949693.1 hypothetical protein [Rhodococcus sp. ARC_M8]QEX13927.1 hypothetical protein F6X56_31470 [Rhodococcus erythropolis]ULD43488.1 hypothetical protein JKI97_10830 [Rhodococcus qingshengii]
MDSRQLFALGALGTGMLSLALQLTPLCLGTENAEQYVFVRAANATAVLTLALLSAAFVFWPPAG